MKPGRPLHGEDRDDLKHVGFKADPETLTAIRLLTAALRLQSGTLPSKSVVIRHYLIEAAKQLCAEQPAPVLSAASPSVEPGACAPKKSKNTKQTAKKSRVTKVSVEE